MLLMFHFYFRNEKKNIRPASCFLIVFSYFVCSAPSAELTLLIQQLDFKTRLIVFVFIWSFCFIHLKDHNDVMLCFHFLHACMLSWLQVFVIVWINLVSRDLSIFIVMSAKKQTKPSLLVRLSVLSVVVSSKSTGWDRSLRFPKTAMQCNSHEVLPNILTAMFKKCLICDSHGRNSVHLGT